MSRQHKINTLYQMISNGDKEGRLVVEEDLIAYFSEMFGTARRTILEYLKVLETNKKIVREKGKIALSHNGDKIRTYGLGELNDGSEAVEQERTADTLEHPNDA